MVRKSCSIFKGENLTCLDLEKLIWNAKRRKVSIEKVKDRKSVYRLALQLIPVLSDDELYALALRAKIQGKEKLFQKCVQELEKRAKTL